MLYTLSNEQEKKVAGWYFVGQVNKFEDIVVILTKMKKTYLTCSHIHRFMCTHMIFICDGTCAFPHDVCVHCVYVLP